MERKKSKHAISFPKNLDMNRFLGTAAARKMAASDQCGNNIYELRGVLLHKGASAYHGHYEAQVFDAVYVDQPKYTRSRKLTTQQERILVSIQ
jgi:ubiquitin carboxyl-terminal hydrolase 48